MLGVVGQVTRCVESYMQMCDPGVTVRADGHDLVWVTAARWLRRVVRLSVVARVSAARAEPRGAERYWTVCLVCKAIRQCGSALLPSLGYGMGEFVCNLAGNCVFSNMSLSDSAPR